MQISLPISYFKSKYSPQQSVLKLPSGQASHINKEHLKLQFKKKIIKCQMGGGRQKILDWMVASISKNFMLLITTFNRNFLPQFSNILNLTLFELNLRVS